MKLRSQLLLKFSTWLTLGAASVFFIYTTNAGLQTIVYCLEVTLPGKLRIHHANGSLNSQTEFSHITYEYQKAELQISKLTLNLRKKSLELNQVSSLEQFIPQILTKTTKLDTFVVLLNYQKDQRTWVVNINTSGLWNAQISHANLTLSSHFLSDLFTPSQISVNNLACNIGKNLLIIKRDELDQYQLKMRIDDLSLLAAKLKGDLYANGSIKGNKKNRILDLTVNSKKISYDGFSFDNIKLDTKNSFNNLQEPLLIKLNISQINLFDDKIKNFELAASGNLLTHKIIINANFLDNKISYHAKSTLSDKIWTVTSVDVDNHLNSKFNFQDSSKFNGLIQLELNDFSQIGELLPKVTRVKAKLDATIKCSGSYAEPIFLVHAEMREITATIPSMGVKIKPMSILLDINQQHLLSINVLGKMRKGVGDFTFNGTMDLNDPNYKNSFKFIGKKVEFIKTNSKCLIADLDLDVIYEPLGNDLLLNGNIDILDGFLHFETTKTIVRSQDIVFTDHRLSTTTKNLNIIPNIYIRIDEPPLHINGFNLDGQITGKLLISYANNNLYGEGRITIKKGTYSLPGQKLTIDRGRIIYPQGTLLHAPILDIKMIKLKSIDKHVIDSGIFVSGTAAKPIFSDIGITGGNDQTLSQALMYGTSIIPNALSEILNISDIGITESQAAQSSNFFANQTSDSNLHNKRVFVGRQVGDKTYIQYQRSLQDAINSINLKYALTENLAISIDGSLQDDSNIADIGADLSFSIEK